MTSDSKVSEIQKRNSISAYFEPVPWMWIVLLSVLGIISITTYIYIGILLIGIAIWLYISTTKKPTDKQIDQFIAEDILSLKYSSLKKMGVDGSQLARESMDLKSWRLWETGGAQVKFKKGKDGVIRYTPIDVIWLHFGKDQLMVYRCALDILKGTPLSVSTDEYFYKDIVSLSTKTESQTRSVTLNGEEKKIQLNSAEIFELRTSGGTAISMFLNDPKLVELLDIKEGNMPPSEVENVIQSVRKMLREKKA
jgi:hypothetical protein